MSSSSFKANIYHIVHEPPTFSQNSGMMALTREVNAQVVRYPVCWKHVYAKSWLAGFLCRRWGMLYYGSIYNDLLPMFDELRIAKQIQPLNRSIVHFMWADFASPSLSRLFKKRGVVIGTYHSSFSRLPRVCARERIFHQYDYIMLMSNSQKPYFLERGYPESQLRVIKHGVDLRFFHPTSVMTKDETAPLQLLLVGATERDHEFAAAVMKKLDPRYAVLHVRTSSVQEVHYNNLDNVRILFQLSDDELLNEYQHADVLFMPMEDCTANNVILEAMACGTPVMTNLVGGISDYVSDSAGYVLKNKHIDEWCNLLEELFNQRDSLRRKSQQARLWAENFSWAKAGNQLFDLYREAFNAN